MILSYGCGMWDVTCGKCKVQCCKEQYFIGTYIRSMNQGKLDIVKKEVARVNINILRISDLKLKGMGKFNSDDKSLRRNGVALIVSKQI